LVINQKSQVISKNLQKIRIPLYQFFSQKYCSLGIFRLKLKLRIGKLKNNQTIALIA